jgi:hypothetical protein
VIGRMASAQNLVKEEIVQTLGTKYWKKCTMVLVKVIQHLLKNVTCKNVLVFNSTKK